MNKILERELNWLYDLAYNVVNPANKEDTDNAYKTIKESLERLEKLEKVVEILKELIKLEKNEGIEKEIIGYEFGVMANPIDKEITKEEYELSKEVFGE